MSALSEVLLWAMRVNGKKDARSHVILDIKPDASLEDAQNAFHKIARMAHPDLHRTTLSPDELEAVTTAYARAAAAYQEFRTQRTQTTRMRTVAADMPARSAQQTPAGGAPVAGNPAASQMSSKALIYYRKAELALRRGDLKGAILQLKMAIAADPQSTFLRSALAEVESEVSKTT